MRLWLFVGVGVGVGVWFVRLCALVSVGVGKGQACALYGVRHGTVFTVRTLFCKLRRNYNFGGS